MLVKILPFEKAKLIQGTYGPFILKIETYIRIISIPVGKLLDMGGPFEKKFVVLVEGPLCLILSAVEWQHMADHHFCPCDVFYVVINRPPCFYVLNLSLYQMKISESIKTVPVETLTA